MRPGRSFWNPGSFSDTTEVFNKKPSGGSYGKKWQLLFQVWYSCRVRYLFFTWLHGLAWSTMCGSASTLQVGDSQPKSVNTSPAKTRLLVTGREGRISEKWTPIIYFFTAVIQTHASNLEWGTCWRLIEKPAADSEAPTWPITNWVILAPRDVHEPLSHRPTVAAGPRGRMSTNPH